MVEHPDLAAVGSGPGIEHVSGLELATKDELARARLLCAKTSAHIRYAKQERAVRLQESAEPGQEIDPSITPGDMAQDPEEKEDDIELPTAADMPGELIEIAPDRDHPPGANMPAEP